MTNHRDWNSIAVFASYAFQSIGQAMSWQFVTYFLKHDLGVSSFIFLTVIWSTPALITMAAVNGWGSLSDKKGRRKPFMILGFAGNAFSFLFFAFVTDGIQYLIVSAIGAVFIASSIPAGQAFLTTRTTSKGERLGLLLMAQSAGWLVGALTSGFLYDLIGMSVIYLIASSLCFAAVFLCLGFVKDEGLKEIEVITRMRFSEVLKIPGMIRLALAAAFSSMGINAVASLMTIMIVDELQGYTWYVGIANSTATFLAVLITWYIGKLIDRRGPVGVLFLAYLSYAIFSIGFAIAPTAEIATILFALPIYPLASTAAYAYAALLSGDSERGSAMGIVNGSQNMGAAIGPIVGGIFAELIFFHVQPISWIGLIFQIVALLLSLTLARRIVSEIDDKVVEIKTDT